MMSKQKHFDLNLLRIFASVYKNQSITKAANDLDLTQSSVSNAIRRLQNNTGGKALFIRTGGGIVPSAVANNLFSQLEVPLLNIDNTLAGLEDFSPQDHAHQFVVYAFDSIIQEIIGKSEEVTKETNIQICYKEISHRQELVHQDLATEQIDLIIDGSTPQSKSFSYQNFVQDRFVCVVKNNHPRINNEITREQFLQEKHIILSFKSANKSAIELYMDEPLPERKVLSEQTSMMSMFASVSQTDGIAITLASYASHYAERFDLTVLELPFSTKPINCYMIWNSKFNDNKSHQWLRKTLLSFVQ